MLRVFVSAQPLLRQQAQSQIARKQRLRGLLLVIVAGWPVSVMAGPPYAGRSLQDVLHDLSSSGLQLVYNDQLVGGGLRVEGEPEPGTDAEILGQVLAPHDLQAHEISPGTYAIVRQSSGKAPPDQDQENAPAATPLEEIVVVSGRYTLATEAIEGRTFLTHDELEALPRVAEDAIKAVHRLPGAATNGLSALAHMRGGEESETQIVFDGFPLSEPFHLRLLQSPVTLLDPRVVDSLDVYSGGFTAQFGDRMSSIVDVSSVRPEADAYYELGLSLFHASALASQRFAEGRGQWFVAARRSNLEEIADLTDSTLGEVSYLDGLAWLDFEISETTSIRLQALIGADRAQITNSGLSEVADADYRNNYLWATLDHQWSPQLSGRAILSYTDVFAEREAAVDEPLQRVGTVLDRREYDVLGLKLDGRYSSESWLHRFGAEVRSLSARYDYRSRIGFEPDYPFPGAPALTRISDLSPSPSGEHYAAYLTSRVRLTDRLTAEVGLRWDEQTYEEESDDQWAPRVNLLWDFDERTRLRASWGRYRQFQGIEELQVEDGVDYFLPTQQAEHSILGLERDLTDGFALRVEAYRKQYTDLRPRYENLFDSLSLAPELRWDRVRIAPSSARAQGVEVLLSRRSEGPWSGWASYAWSRVYDREDGVETLRSWDQRNSFSAGLTWSEDPWQATATILYHTGWPVTPVRLDESGPEPRVAVGARNSARYPAFASLDLRLSREFALKHGSLSAFVELTNALDRGNPCCTDFSPETTDDGAIRLEQEYRYWLPLIPSLGVLWKY